MLFKPCPDSLGKSWAQLANYKLDRFSQGGQPMTIASSSVVRGALVGVLLLFAASTAQAGVIFGFTGNTLGGGFRVGRRP